MTENTIDLKQLLFLIREQKELEINYILDEGCVLETEDAKPLIKVINYFFNYLAQLTQHPLEVSLDLLPETYKLSFLAYCSLETLPDLSDQIQKALDDYNATFKVTHLPDKYVQVNVAFKK